ncbi:uracil-xanthine permease family protein [Teredinibacter turnerae]|uniref:uracil-xanthine permease family protein n=1 Tax=Teredinibacter turnerae TaxID=2426 RepID=UPI000404D7BB|nr:solute carrier family 23 protein [Teredinibacter turnerae]
MSDSRLNVPMLVGLNDRPSAGKTLLASLQHVLAVFGGIVTAPLIIALGMKLSPVDTAYLVSSSLVISGVATLIQVSRVGPIGSGLLSIQGTSFTFIGPLIFSYYTLLNGASSAQALGAVLGTSGVCALCMLVLVQFVEHLRRWITTNVSGTAVALIGISLVWTTLKNLYGDYTRVDTYPGWWVLALALLVFVITLILVRTGNALLRMTSITIGLLIGFGVAWTLGMVDTAPLNAMPNVFVPSVTQFPLSFDLTTFLVLMPVYLISATESLGDLTATSKLSGLAINNRAFWRRVRGGLSGDALNSFIAAIFCTFPNTTFSQNNGVIRLTGVCSPYVGRFVAVMLIVLGLFPIVGGFFVIMPAAVLSGATLLMFIMVFISGLMIVAGGDARVRSWPLVTAAVIFGLVCSVVVPLLSFLPQWLKSFLQFPISTGAICAFILELFRAKPAPVDAEPCGNQHAGEAQDALSEGAQ